MKDKQPKIYRMNDCDTVIAYSKEEAIKYYFEEGNTCESLEWIATECEEEKRLSKGMWFVCSKEDMWERALSLNEHKDKAFRVGQWNCDPAMYVTFQYIIDNLLSKVDIPGTICSTEY